MSTYPRTGMQRVLAGSTNPVLRATFRGQDGDPVDATGAVTCNLERVDGTVLATGRAATNPSGTGTYEVALTTAEAAVLDVIKVGWFDGGVQRATTWHRIVGGFMFGIGELQSKLGMAQFTAAQLRAERDRITDLIERETGVAWCPQYDLESFDGYGRLRHVTTWRPLRTVRSLQLDDVAVDVSGLRVDTPAGVFYSDQSLVGWTELGYEHGFDQPTEALRDAALIAAGDRLQREFSALSSRVRRSTNDMGMTVEYSFAGRDHPTGIDEVDAVIMAHDMRSPGFG
jgi:hypothetical protein